MSRNCLGPISRRCGDRWRVPTDDDNLKTALYRVVDADDRLLYVGISFQPFVRLQQHERKQPWWNETKRVHIEWYASRVDAEDAEIVAIRAEMPRYNRNGEGGSRSRRLTPAKPEPIELPRTFVRGG